ncbi:M24 family metallopeptidase [Candidatus Gottesmanbacteria bacterium]|nr:M24 family metallopeptidase [Candidatus Gottesmanbacteria bacterium]
MHDRIQILQKSFERLHIDSLFISDQYNVSYLTGFVGLSPNEREGFLFVTKREAYLLTFPTSYGLYPKKEREFKTLCITYDIRLSDHLEKILQKSHSQSMGVEKQNLTLSEFESLSKKLSVRLKRTEGIVENLRVIKTREEIGKIKIASEVADRAFSYILKKVSKGVCEKELAIEIESFIKRNSDDVSFPPIVAIDESSAIPHYMSGTKRRVQKGSLILLDFGAKFKGYCSDMTRVIFYKTPSFQKRKMYETVFAAQKKALNALTAGISASSVDKIARKIIEETGFPPYPHGLGHGVGCAIHEAPRLKKGSKEKLGKNMVVTVEPGIYIEDYGGVRIEDLVVLRSKGAEILTKSTKEMIIL